MIALIDAPTAATVCVGLMSATAVVCSTILKLVPQKHVVQTKEGDRCATQEQLNSVAADLEKKLNEQTKEMQERHRHVITQLDPVRVGVATLVDRTKR